MIVDTDTCTRCGAAIDRSVPRALGRPGSLHCAACLTAAFREIHAAPQLGSAAEWRVTELQRRFALVLYQAGQTAPAAAYLLGVLGAQAMLAAERALEPCQLCEQERELEPGSFTPHEHAGSFTVFALEHAPEDKTAQLLAAMRSSGMRDVTCARCGRPFLQRDPPPPPIHCPPCIDALRGRP